jgi:hypothetical protein
MFHERRLTGTFISEYSSRTRRVESVIVSPVIYDPPYDSPLEDLFAWNVSKYFDPSVDLHKQVEVDTICGRFRMDFVATLGDSGVAFECDGAQYHDELRDEWRDAMILGGGKVDFIYRLRGHDLVHHLEDCLYLVSKLNPDLFSGRGLGTLSALASDEAKACETKDIAYATRFLVTYGLKSNGSVDMISVQRTQRLAPDKVIFWKRIYAFAQENGGGNLDELIDKWMEPWHIPENEDEDCQP